MGDGKKLKEILDKKNMSISRLAKETGMNRQTIYSIVKRDSYIRYDFALRMANVLEIDVNEICEKEILPLFSDNFNEVLNNNRLKSGNLRRKYEEANI